MNKPILIIKNKKIYLFTTIKIIISSLSSFFIIYNIILKKDFINSIVYDNGKNSFILLSLIGVCYLISYLSNIINKIFDKKMKVIYKKETKSLLMKKMSNIKYEVLENQKTQDLVKRLEKADEKAIDFINIINGFIMSFIQIVGTIYLLKDLNIFLIMPILFFLIFGVYLNLKEGKNLYGFWSKYMRNVRKSNYYSEILTERDYALEKNIFQYSKFVNQKFRKEFDKARENNKKNGLKRFKIQALTEIISLSYTFLCFILLLFPLMSKTITVGYYISIVEALNNLFNTVKSLFYKLPEVSEYKSFIKDFDIFMKKEEEKNEYKKRVKNIKSIDFKNVWFKYPETDNFILKDCNFRIEQDKHYALVGLNGEGKSTIIKLILGLYNPSKGDIVVNDIYNIRDLNLDCYRKLMGIIFQDYTKFPFNIEENIKIGNIEKEIKLEKIEEIMNKINSRNFLNNYDKKEKTLLTVINEKGIDLSGGEWQKLLLARLLFSDKSFNVLDEPTSSIDPISESIIYEVYNKELKGKMTLFITHRLASTKFVNKILVLKDGKIIEEGNHNYLMGINGEYSLMYKEQRRLYEKRI